MNFVFKNLYYGPPDPGLKGIFGFPKRNDLKLWLGDKRAFYTHKARVAIRQACLILGVGEDDEILAPAYNCGTEIDALMTSKASIVLYRTDKKGRIDFDDLSKRVTEKTKLVYVTHNFGFPQPLEELKSFCDEKGLYLIEDCALSLLSNDGEKRIGSVGDIAVYNFSKTLPVPDGGALVINNQDLHIDDWVMQAAPLKTVFRNMLPFFKRNVLRMLSGTGILYGLFWNLLTRKRVTDFAGKSNSTGFPDMPSGFYYDDKLTDTKMSRITRRMLGTFNVSEIMSRRRDNFLRYADLLSGDDYITPLYKELPEGVCPLYFPVSIDRHEQVAQELKKLSIDAIAWWSGYHRALPWPEYPDACFLKDSLLVLPVHQQLSDVHVVFIVQKLLSIIRKLKNQLQ